jgi:maltose O-acetyltransferase
VTAHPSRERAPSPGRTVAVGRTGDPKSLRQVVGIVARMTREDLIAAARYYPIVKVAGARIVPRPLRYVLYRMAGVRLRQSDIGAGLFIGGPASNLTIGHGTSINVDCFFDCLAKVTLGRNVMVGMGVMIVTSDHPIGPDGRPQGNPVGRDVVIEDRVWLGARSMVLPGVRVGEGTVISAGAVVTRDCRPLSIYAGSPARLIGQLPTGPATDRVAPAGSAHGHAGQVTDAERDERGEAAHDDLADRRPQR